MAAKKKEAKKKEAKMEKTAAETLRDNYATLAKLNEIAQEAMQAAYRFSRENTLIYTPPKVVYDSDDTMNDQHDYEESWDSSYC